MSAINMSYSLLVMTYDRLYAIRDPYGNRPLCVGTIYDAEQADPTPVAYCAASESCALPGTAKLNFEELAVTMSAINMSYSLLVMTYDRLYAIRDPYGNRPLCVGTVYNAEQADPTPVAYCAASESCALPGTAKLNFEVEPGEIVEISREGIRSVFQMKPQTPQAACIFEYVYFARNDSIIEGQQVQTVSLVFPMSPVFIETAMLGDRLYNRAMLCDNQRFTRNSV
ncbi:hypothetical protein ANCDUO_14186 [Ancylostoma duodenale]|uniref:Glutamine amidotransferase type-2 domain-containing protein n=1 Tax=Ancylostoma duodenale TaxID=51022 RepID=A0A0C2D0U3_9BILA|nr:hypothetical protein ANCDUO_14186 [Ancylostoma duodenale]